MLCYLTIQNMVKDELSTIDFQLLDVATDLFIPMQNVLRLTH